MDKDGEYVVSVVLWWIASSRGHIRVFVTVMFEESAVAALLLEVLGSCAGHERQLTSREFP